MNLQQGTSAARSPGKAVDKRRYLELVLKQPVDWLKYCVENPGPYMRPIHVALIRIAIRRKVLSC